MATPVIVMARTKAKPGAEDTIKQGLIGLAAQSRAEVGCINYDLHQSFDDPSLFLVFENWSSKDALDKHMETSYFKEFVSKAADLLTQPPEITLWKRVG